MDNRGYFSMIEGIITNIISNILWIILIAAATVCYFFLRKFIQWIRISALKKFLALVTISCTASFVATYYGIVTLVEALVFCLVVITTLASAYLYGFSRIGVIATFENTVRGIDYSTSLLWSKRSFDFLGVGAHKLTTDSEFSKMVARCSDAGRPIRLLLSPPTNPVLQKVANRSGTASNTYERRVKDSLRIIGDLVLVHGRNIQVRFYKATSESDFHQFRLVFIDDKYCILSFTVWDNQEGRSNPQMILAATDKEESHRSIYYAFRDYFERIWADENTVEVNLRDYQ